MKEIGIGNNEKLRRHISKIKWGKGIWGWEI